MEKEFKTGCRVIALISGGLLTFSAFSITTSAKAASTVQAPLTSEMAAELSQNINRPVIVIMKNLLLSGSDITNDQEPLMGELRKVNALRIKSYHVVNSFAATVSEGEVERLKANPSVARVVPDVILHHTVHAQLHTQSDSNISTTPSPTPSLIANIIAHTCGANGQALLDPEALQTTNTNSDDPSVQTARALGFTGAGVRVAFIADGVDIANTNFIRADGSSAFVDYQDFSGDGANAVTAGGEAFLDSNAIAGQGLHVYDINGFSAQANPSPCNIRIEGMAPGAALIGLKVFSQSNITTESNFLQAIDYAATTAHVDVLNESFGVNYFPDVTAFDITKIFNDAAVKAGVTVTVSSGDAGSTNTIGGPATDPLVISVGASTTFRFYAQTNSGGARYFATTGWLNDNISALSSGGFDETARTMDIVAPGDLGFSSCTGSATYQDCTNFLNQPSSIEESGGTSLASPLSAGAAALVIEAYRKTHQGASPSPALVKQILTSTATDLGLPAMEQGSGLLNSYKAVLLALSVDGGSEFSLPHRAEFGKGGGKPLLLSENQLTGIGGPGSSYNWPVTITNPTSTGQLVHVSGRTFGPAENLRSGQLILNDASSPQFINGGGKVDNYGKFTFSVAKGAERLNASIAYPGTASNTNSAVKLVLIDPQGRFAANTLPQGVGNFGNVDVRKPAAGTWTGIVSGSVASAGGTNGTVVWQVSTQKSVPFGSVSPSVFFLFPGKSRTITVSASTPLTAGDTAGSVVVSSTAGGVDQFAGVESTSIAVTLRSLIDVTKGGTFSGLLTGGNGRSPGEGQMNYYQFNVDAGRTSVTANIALTNDAADSVGAYLVNPDGVALGFGQNSLNGTNGLSLSATALNPAAGTWTLIVDFAGAVVGDEISQPFTGEVKLDTVNASAPLLPGNTGTQITAGAPLSVPVTVTNNSANPKAIFIDARTDTTTSLTLSAIGVPAGFQGYPLPNPFATTPLWLVPTQTSSLQVIASANVPVEFDYGPYSGDPDLFGSPSGAAINGTYSASSIYSPNSGTVSQGTWDAFPDEIGPYPASGAPSGTANMTLIAITKGFDPAVSCATGDMWLGSVNSSYAGFSPVVVNPGESVVIDVTITPSGASGTVVSGTLYVDEVISAVPPYSENTGNELAQLSYRYTIH